MTDDEEPGDLSPAGSPAGTAPVVGPTVPMGAATVPMAMRAGDPGQRSPERVTESPPPREAMVELNALLGHGTHYTGKLSFEGRIRVEGRFEGEIRGDVLVIGGGADLQADIEVQVCIVTGGHVRGDIRARDAIELHAPAVVVGDLHAPNVFIDRGVQFEGSCKMAPLEEDEPAPAAADVEAATAPSEHVSEPGDAPGPASDQDEP